MQMDRRGFFTVSALAGGGLWLGLGRAQAAPGDTALLNAWVSIAADNHITIMASNPEVGQGVRTSMPMLIAEELDVDWAQVTTAPTLANAKIYGRQVAGGSMATTLQYEPLRRVGAAARALLVTAAAQKWGVPEGELTTGNAIVRHAASGRSARYGELAAAAALLPAPDAARLVLKDPAKFRIIGKATPGVDNRAIVTGKPLFGIDAVVPGMKHAVYHKSGTTGAAVARADLAALRARPGVRDAFILAPNDEMAGGVAIVADNTWAAMQARSGIDCEWTRGAGAFQSSAAWADMAAKASSGGPQKSVVANGDAKAAMARAAKTVRAEYAYPFLPHVPLEPINCTARVSGDTVEIWASTQNPEPGRKAVAKVLGVPEANVTIHMLRCGGGFGRRLMNDYMVEAAVIARQAGVPIKLTWSREDDIAFDWLRPGGWHVLAAGLDSAGKVIAWDNHFISYGKAEEFARAAAIGPTDFPCGFIDDLAIGATILPLEHHTGYLRAPENNAFGFVTQGFIDELAHAAGQDPLMFRRGFLGASRVIGDPTKRGAYHAGRMRGVLDKAADMAGWGRKLPARTGLGIAFHFSHLGYFATVIEAAVDSGGAVTVKKVWVAGDVGRQIVNPSAALAQVQGSVLDALGAAMASGSGQAITFADGAIEQRNFGDVPLLRISEVPPVEVQFVLTDFPVTGLGEPAYPAVAPALANALFAATGVRLRSLPLDMAALKA
ncbi:molybdopterin cofactor-binding domain-containing protein [Sandarakinorhabdus sp.]|uniref:xanthine dehydrogenase family protein molybdopterin-binding subunit n=1 Tax=Sandarakinorhabdus sp. TaxID=1916663 RepID=UPI00286E7106|nr:molybdopterin cofactor-binding domain-containing protein [Sandarakinorhabdus sp.]